MTVSTRHQESGSKPGVLHVEWIAGPEERTGGKCKVIVDAVVEGDVDTDLELSPGRHVVRVQKQWLKTRKVSVSIQPERRTVLEYQSGGLVYLIQSIAVSAATAAVAHFWMGHAGDRFAALATGAVAAGVGLATLAAAYGLQVYLERRGVTVLPEGSLELLPASEAVASPTGDAAGQSVRGYVPRGGRLVVDVNMPAQRGIQPPRPNLLVDGRSLGTVAKMYRVPAGRHTVQVRGWFDSSNRLPVSVQPGKLLELECSATGRTVGAAVFLIVVFMGLVFGTILLQDRFNWSSQFLIRLVTAEIVGSLVLLAVAANVATRYTPTMRLTLK